MNHHGFNAVFGTVYFTDNVFADEHRVYLVLDIIWYKIYEHSRSIILYGQVSPVWMVVSAMIRHTFHVAVGYTETRHSLQSFEEVAQFICGLRWKQMLTSWWLDSMFEVLIYILYTYMHIYIYYNIYIIYILMAQPAYYVYIYTYIHRWLNQPPQPVSRSRSRSGRDRPLCMASYCPGAQAR